VHIGVHIAQHGRLADPAVVRASALAAEELGYRSVWVVEGAARNLDPLLTLTYAAAATSRVRLGTSFRSVPPYPADLLVRAFDSLGVLSGGRTVVGLGSCTDAELDELATTWDAEATSPRPPVLLSGRGPEELDRVARRADGWNPAGVPVPDLAGCWDQVRTLAAGHGRDPETLGFVVRADLVLTDADAGPDRASYEGSLAQVLGDLEATAAAGAHEVLLGVTGDHDLDAVLGVYATLAEGLETV